MRFYVFVVCCEIGTSKSQQVFLHCAQHVNNSVTRLIALDNARPARQRRPLDVIGLMLQEEIGTENLDGCKSAFNKSSFIKFIAALDPALSATGACRI